MHQSCVLFLSWHVMTEVFVDVLQLADCCGKVMPSQLHRTGSLEETLQRAYEGQFTGQAISLFLHFSANTIKHKCCSNSKWLTGLSVTFEKETFFFLSKPCFMYLYYICYFESFEEAYWLIPVYMNGYNQLFPTEIICLWMWLILYLGCRITCCCLNWFLEGAVYLHYYVSSDENKIIISKQSMH